MQNLEIFTNPDAARTVLQNHLPGFSHHQLQIDRCRILNSRYKTFLKDQSNEKSFLSICYQLGISRRENGAVDDHILYAKIFPPHASDREFSKTLNLRLSQPKFGMALSHLADFDMLVWSFPNDPTLTSLQDIMRLQSVKRYFPYQHIACKSPEHLTALQTTVVNYRPEIRCTTRFEISFKHRDKIANLVLYGKTFADDSGAEIYQRNQNLWRLLGQSKLNFKIARPLDYVAEIRTIWQQALPGVSLLSLINARSNRAIFKSIAQGLANFHELDWQVGNRITVDEILSECRKKAGKLLNAFPEQRETITAIHHQLQAVNSKLPPVNETLIHGDFHINQLLYHRNQIALFDFDELAIGDPMQDLANFIVDLLTQPIDANLAISLSRVFLNNYSKLKPICVERLRWHLTAQFLTKAYRLYWQQAECLPDKINKLLSLARQGVPELLRQPV
ncbi:MAG: aminoglycoside phosphotransferase family protein [Acidobacteriota bacterium]